MNKAAPVLIIPAVCRSPHQATPDFVEEDTLKLCTDCRDPIRYTCCAETGAMVASCRCQWVSTAGLGTE